MGVPAGGWCGGYPAPVRQLHHVCGRPLLRILDAAVLCGLHMRMHMLLFIPETLKRELL